MVFSKMNSADWYSWMDACNGEAAVDGNVDADDDDMSSWPLTQCWAASRRTLAVTLVAVDTSSSFSFERTGADGGNDDEG